jgi:purine-nucleoside phosphorylase
MESYGLYCTANRLHKKALCLLTVTDHFIHKDQKATVEERQNNLLEMIALAVSTAEEYAD